MRRGEWSCCEPRLADVIGSPRGLCRDGQRRIHRGRRRHEARVDDEQVWVVVGAAERIERGRGRVVPEADGAALMRWRPLVERSGENDRIAGGAEDLAFCRDRLAWPADRLNPPPLIDGNDLQALGHTPGPAFRTILDRVRDAQLEGQPQEVQDEIIRINTDARPRALQVALLVPIAAGLIGLGNAFRMRRLPDPIPSGASEGMLFD